jgi:hypothetical protein
LASLRGEDDRVVGVELHAVVLVGRHERQGAHRLSLGAGADHADLFGLEAVDLLDVDDALVGQAEEPHRPGQADVLVHRPAEEGDRPAGLDGDLGDLLHPVDVGGEAGGDDPLLAVLPEQLPQHDTDRRLRRRVAGLLGVGRVGQEESHAAAADLADEGKVRHAAVDRVLVELEVAGVQDRAGRREDGGGEAVGHRVGDRDELAVEGADLAALAVGHRDQFGAGQHPRLLDPVPGQPERQGGAVDRQRSHLGQQEGQASAVVLVAVGENDALEALGVLPEVGEVGEDEVDAGHVGVGEHDPAVEEQDPVVDLDAGAVAPDLTEASEKDNAGRGGHGE